MLNEQMVKRLSKEQRKQLDELHKEYEEATKGIRTRRIGGPDIDSANRHHKATKELAEFYTRHHLIR